MTLPESTSVQSVTIIACVSEDGASPGDNGCSCTDYMVEELEFTFVAMSMIFNIPDLVSFTSYCVQAIGNYTTEITGGIGLVARTASELGWGGGGDTVGLGLGVRTASRVGGG